MTAQEMHIGVTQWLQKVNSKDIVSYEPQEIDWALNEECLRFIKQRTNPLSNSKKQGFQATQKRYDDLEELITQNYLIPMYKDNSNVNSVFGFLPPNYLSLINDRSLTHNLCGRALSTVSTNVVSEYVCVVPFPEPVETSSPFYNSLSFIDTATSNVLFDVNNYNSTINGFDAKEEKFYIINLLIEELSKLSNIEIRWEKYNETYYRNSIIFISKSPLFTGITVQPINTSIPVNVINYVQYAPLNVEEVENRLVKTEELYDILSNSFTKTVAESPISNLARGKINVHHKQKFILSFTKIDYIRKPRKIDLFLGQSCELNPNVHEEIVENTAKRLSAIVKAENYQQIINENLITE